MRYQKLEQKARSVLASNDRDGHTAPSPGMYDHAWLWDEAFICIGLAHDDPRRAARELDFIFDAQWQNGMIPNMRFAPGSLDYLPWGSKRLNPDAPRHVHTSGITQPPVLAEAVQRVARKLDRDDRIDFTARSLGRLAAYHQWIYNDRDFDGSGLFAAVHPWETGMENTPTWMEHMRTLDWGRFDFLLRGVVGALQSTRRDTKHISLGQRANGDESLQFMRAALKLRRSRYSRDRLADYPLHLQDVQLNSILVRNNEILTELAAEANYPLDDELLGRMALTRTNLDAMLWDETDGLYYPRDAVSGNHIKIATVSSLLPLYAGSIPTDRTDALVSRLNDPESFSPMFGVPTVPLDSLYYRRGSYWTGPTWVNTNWLLIDGLERSEQEQRARRLAQSTLYMTSIGGMHEYFDAKTAEGLGAKDFSWTAALTLDLLTRFAE